MPSDFPKTNGYIRSSHTMYTQAKPPPYCAHVPRKRHWMEWYLKTRSVANCTCMCATVGASHAVRLIRLRILAHICVCVWCTYNLLIVGRSARCPLTASMPMCVATDDPARCAFIVGEKETSKARERDKAWTNFIRTYSLSLSLSFLRSLHPFLSSSISIITKFK